MAAEEEGEKPNRDESGEDGGGSDDRPSGDDASKDGGSKDGGSKDGESAEGGEKDGDDKPKKPSIFRKTWVKVLTAVLVLLLIVLGVLFYLWYSRYGRFQQSTDDAYLQADSVAVSPRISGYVTEVLVADNQQVLAGQPLARIDPREYVAARDRAQAQIDTALANEVAIEAQIAEQEATVLEAKAQLDANRTDYDFAESEVKRYAPLAASGAETKEKLAQLVNQRDRARDQVRVGEATVEAQQRRIASLQAQVGQAEAQANTARAELETAQVDVDATTLTASIAGTVGDKTVRLGQFVQMGTRLMTLVPVDAIYLEANFKENQIGLMRVGQPATVEVDALPGVAIPGAVDSFTPGTGAQFSILPPENATGNFTKIVQRVPVRIRVDAGPEARRVLVPGLSIVVSVDTRSAAPYEDRLEGETDRQMKERDEAGKPPDARK